MCVYIYIYTYIHMYVCTYTHVYIHVYIYIEREREENLRDTTGNSGSMQKGQFEKGVLGIPEPCCTPSSAHLCGSPECCARVNIIYYHTV